MHDGKRCVLESSDVEPGATDIDAIAAVPAEQYEAQRFHIGFCKRLSTSGHILLSLQRLQGLRHASQPLRQKTDAFSALGGCTLEAVCGSNLLIAWSDRLVYMVYVTVQVAFRRSLLASEVFDRLATVPHCGNVALFIGVLVKKPVFLVFLGQI